MNTSPKIQISGHFPALRRATLPVVAVLVASLTLTGCLVLASGPDREAPGVPRTVTAEPGDASATVSWQRPEKDGGATLLGYRAWAVEDSTRYCEVDASEMSCVIQGLYRDPAYSFVVRAWNRVGPGPVSAPSETVNPQVTLPGAPDSVRGEAGHRRVTVSWTVPADVGSGVAGYVASVEGDSSLSCTSGETGTSCVIAGLENGTAYTFTARAFNAAGKGPVSETSTLATPGRFAAGAGMWESVRLPVPANLHGLAYQNDRFVAVGEGGAILTSGDARDWEPRSGETSQTLLSVAAGNGLFVATGVNGTILTSPDGEAWTSRSSGVGDMRLRKVAWGGDRFVAVGGTSDNAAGVLLFSTDGISWTRVPGSFPSLWGVEWGGHVDPDDRYFVATGHQGSIVTSMDGINWVSRGSTAGVILGWPTWGMPSGSGDAGLWVAVGESGMISTSPDGATWTQRDWGGAIDLYSAIWVDGMFVALGVNGIMLTSPDGVTWQRTDLDNRTSTGGTLWLRGILLEGDRILTTGSPGFVLIAE